MKWRKILIQYIYVYYVYENQNLKCMLVYTVKLRDLEQDVSV